MLKIRNATPDDLDSIVELWGVAGGPTRTPSTDWAATALLQADPRALLVAEHDGIIVGTVIVGWDGWRCHLYRLAVDTGQRRKGVATRLLEAAVARAKEVGASRVDAMVDSTNERGVAFWEASPLTLDEVEQRWSLMIQQ